MRSLRSRRPVLPNRLTDDWIARGKEEWIRASKAEFKRFLLMAIGSSSEMLVWIDYCRDMKYIDTNVFQTWSAEYESIHKMLQAFYSRA
jgi:four helix bundle protein